MLDKWSVWLYASVFKSIFTGFEEVLSVYSVKKASISDLVERASLWTPYMGYISYTYIKN